MLTQTVEIGSKVADGKESRAPQCSGEQENSAFTVPAISLPKGGSAIRCVGEKFAANPVMVTGSMTVPIAVHPIMEAGFGAKVSDFELANSWVERNCAGGYIIVGDPAVRLRVEQMT